MTCFDRQVVRCAGWRERFVAGCAGAYLQLPSNLLSFFSAPARAGLCSNTLEEA